MRIAKYIDKHDDYIYFHLSESGEFVIDGIIDGALFFNSDDLLNMIHDLQRFYNEIKSREIKENSIKKTPKLN